MVLKKRLIGFGISKQSDLTQGPLIPQILLFALPVMATGVLQLLFNTADSIVVGRWGGSTPDECETALAAVGSCGSLINLLVNLAFGLSVGTGVLVARGIGAKRYDQVERVVHTSILLALISGLIVCGIGVGFSGPLLTLMGTSPAVLDQAVPYMVAYFLGTPANMIYNYCAAILRSEGNTTHPLLFLTLAGFVNFGLNLVMVLCFGLGALGVGIATAASQWMACILALRHLLRERGPCRFQPKKLRIHAWELKQILAIGLPAGIQGSVFSISNVLIQSSINSFGKATVAANTAASNLENYVYIAQNSFYHTVLTFVGQNYGANNHRRLKSSMLACMGCVTAVGLLTGGIVLLLGKPLLGIFVPDNAEAVRIGMVRMWVIVPGYFLCGLMDVGSGVLRGLGMSVRSTVTSLLGACATRIIWIFTVFRMVPTLQVLCLSYPISWALTAAVHYSFCFSALHRLLKNQSKKEMQKEIVKA